MAEDWTACCRQVEEAPQRPRVLVKIASTRTHLPGQSGHFVDFRWEMVELARQAGEELDDGEGQESDG